MFFLYEEVRSATDPVEAWRRWRDVRDELFAHHPQSPIPAEQRRQFRALPYFDHNPDARVEADVREVEHRTYEIPTSGDGPVGAYAFTRIATLGFELGGRECELELYWLEGYGGGLFLPFRDATSGSETYGACRYLLDTVKGADLGVDRDGDPILDFNFAYNPSCSYDPSWVCPLAPPPNRLSAPVRAGERLGEG